MKIGTCESKPGEISEGMLTLATLPRGESVQIPVKIAQGQTEGKTMFISSGIHGDELNGIELNRRFFRYFLEHEHIKGLIGTIVFLPILNPSGFFVHERFVSFDGKDLNRCFNASDGKTISNQMADTFLSEVIAQCDYGLDLHDSGTRNVLLPHCRVHKEKSTGCTVEIGSLFGLDLIAQRLGKEGMMAVEAHEKFGIPVVTVEVGGGGVLWNTFLDRAVVGIRNILTHFGFLSGKIILPEKQFVIDLSGREGYHAEIPGMVDIKVLLGEAVEKDALLARIYNPLNGQEHEIHAKECGVVFSRRMKANVQLDDPIVIILGFEEVSEKSCRLTSKTAQVIINKETEKVQVIESEVFLKALGLRV